MSERQLINMDKAHFIISATMLVSFILAAFWIGCYMTDLKRDMQELRDHVKNDWMRTDQIVFAYELAEKNRTMNIPTISKRNYLDESSQ